MNVLRKDISFVILAVLLLIPAFNVILYASEPDANVSVTGGTNVVTNVSKFKLASIENSPGACTNITYYCNTESPMRGSVGLLLKETLEGLDIDGDGYKGDIAVDLLNLTWNDYKDLLESWNMTMLSATWTPDIPDPDNMALAFLYGNLPGYYSYYNNYSNSDINYWIEMARKESDPLTRNYYYALIDEKAAEEVAHIPFAQHTQIRVERDEVEGYEHNPYAWNSDFFFKLSKSSPTENAIDSIVKHRYRSSYTVDPARSYTTSDCEAVINIYETLIAYKNYSITDELMPLLASSMPVWNAAGDQCNISLRTGITFHDGTPFNASCVKYSFDRVAIIDDPDGPNYLWGGFAKGGPEYRDLVSVSDADVEKFVMGADGDISTPDQFVTVVNETMVTLTLENPYTPFESLLSFTVASILSPTYDMTHLSGFDLSSYSDFDSAMIASMKAQKRASPGYMNYNACGTGPYELDKWYQGENYTLKAYSSYWGGPYSEQPAITNVTVFLDQDLVFRVGNISTGFGYADIIELSTADLSQVSYQNGDFSTWGDPANEKYPGVNVTVGLDTWYMISLAMNHVIEPFTDLNTRLGIAYAFPYDDCIDQAFGGHAKKATSTFPIGMLGHGNAFTYYTNTTKAIEYFRAADVGVAPAIADVYHEPAVPGPIGPSDSVNVYANITDSSGIEQATLHVRTNGGSWSTIPMNVVSGSIYRSVILGLGVDPMKVEYYITAIDQSIGHNNATADNKGLYYSYTVGAPVIDLVSPANGSYCRTGITIYIDVDAYSGISEVLYNWNGNDNQTSNDPYDITFTGGTGQQVLNVYVNSTSGAWTHQVFVFTTDDNPPGIDLSNTVNNSFHQPGTVIHLSVADNYALSHVLYNWDGGGNVTLDAPYSAALPSEAGQHVLTVYANDTAGNRANKAFVFTVDGIDPVITLTSPGNDSLHQPGITVNLSVTDDNLLSHVLCNWDGGGNITLDTPYKTPLPTVDGQHVLRVFANDSAGNGAGKTFVFTTDGTAPEITGYKDSGLHQDITVAGTHTITVEVEDENGIERVEFLLDGELKYTDTSTPYTWSWITTSTTNGDHVVTIRVIDNAGNVKEESYNVKVENQQAGLPLEAIIGVATAVAIPVGTFIYFRSFSFRHRKIINMYMKQNLSLEEIAKRTGKSPREIEELLKKAKKM